MTRLTPRHTTGLDYPGEQGRKNNPPNILVHKMVGPPPLAGLPDAQLDRLPNFSDLTLLPIATTLCPPHLLGGSRVAANLYFEEMCLSLYTHRTMRGTQNCSWLKVVIICEPCGKQCMGEFCKLHSYRIRVDSILSKPCRKCGRATQSEPQLCTSCGTTVAKINIRRTKKKARTFNKWVLAELVKSTTQQ